MLGQLLKKLWWLVAIILIVGYSAIFQKGPCDTPIQYKIGSFDSKFGISQTDFLSSVHQAAGIWESSIGGKELFKYNQNGNLIINLVYDERQQTTQRNAVLEKDINRTSQLADSVEQRYLSLKNEYNVTEQEYTEKVKQFNREQIAYNSRVDYWNRIGGAPKDEYNKLIAEQNSLDAEYAALESERIEVNRLANQINAFIDKYKLLADHVNSNIDVINRSAGKEFDQGLYDPNKNEIDIYEFSNSKELTLVLAHELGHALGLEHNNNTESIMYAVMDQNQNEKLSADDLQQIKSKCNPQ